MQTENKTEYATIRSEMEQIKGCTTHYMSFLLLGVGGVFSFWGTRILSTSDNVSYLSIAYSAFALSIFSLLMLVILTYKFVSHNRYAGYCLLLGSEWWVGYCDHIKEMAIWELCVDILRSIENSVTVNRPPLYNSCSMAYQDIPVELRSDSERSFRYLRYLFRSSSALKTGSWSFPVRIVRIFYVVIFLCIAVGWYVLLLPGLDKAAGPTTLYCQIEAISHGDWTVIWSRSSAVICTLFAIMISTIQVFFCRYVVTRLHSVMSGPETVLSYYHRFKPIRAVVLRDFGIRGFWH